MLKLVWISCTLISFIHSLLIFSKITRWHPPLKKGISKIFNDIVNKIFLLGNGGQDNLSDIDLHRVTEELERNPFQPVSKLPMILNLDVSYSTLRKALKSVVI